MKKYLILTLFVLIFLTISPETVQGVWISGGCYSAETNCESNCYTNCTTQGYAAGYCYEGYPQCGPVTEKRTCWCWKETVADCATACSGYDSYYCYPSSNWCGQFPTCSDSTLWSGCAYQGSKTECPGASPYCYCLNYAYSMTCAAAGETVTINILEDAEVRAASPNSVYNRTYLLAYGNATNVWRHFIKYDLSSIPAGATITSAVHYAHVGSVYSAVDGESNTDYHKIADDSWSETTLTWSNQPAYGVLIDSALPTASGEWASWDITGYAQEEFGGDKVLSVLGKARSEACSGACGYWYRSSESSPPPYLEVTYTSGAAPSPCGGTASYVTPLSATASSEYSSSFSASKAIDGNTGSGWYSQYNAPPRWIYFDLGSEKCISGIKGIFYTYGYPIIMDIQISNDTISWTTVVSSWSVTDTSYQWKEELFTEAHARYLRLNETAFQYYGNCCEMQIKTRNYTP